MDVWNDLSWFAVQTEPWHEEAAAKHVALHDVEVFCPRIKREQLVCGTPRQLSKSLFPGYFFALFIPLLSLDVVRHAPRVIRVVGTNRYPIPVPIEVVTQIQERLEPDGFLRVGAAPLHEGDRVVIERGPLMGWIGRVERERDDGRRVMILLEAIQQARVVVERGWVASVVEA